MNAAAARGFSQLIIFVPVKPVGVMGDAIEDLRPTATRARLASGAPWRCRQPTISRAYLASQCRSDGRASVPADLKGLENFASSAQASPAAISSGSAAEPEAGEDKLDHPLAAATG